MATLHFYTLERAGKRVHIEAFTCDLALVQAALVYGGSDTEWTEVPIG